MPSQEPVRERERERERERKREKKRERKKRDGRDEKGCMSICDQGERKGERV